MYNSYMYLLNGIFPALPAFANQACGLDASRPKHIPTANFASVDANDIIKKT